MTPLQKVSIVVGITATAVGTLSYFADKTAWESGIALGCRESLKSSNFTAVMVQTCLSLAGQIKHARIITDLAASATIVACIPWISPVCEKIKNCLCSINCFRRRKNCCRRKTTPSQTSDTTNRQPKAQQGPRYNRDLLPSLGYGPSSETSSGGKSKNRVASDPAAIEREQTRIRNRVAAGNI